MLIREPDSPVPTLLIENFFEKDELERVMAEADALRSLGLLQSPEKTGTATDHDGTILKNNSGIFLDPLYVGNRDASTLLIASHKIFKEQAIIDAISGHSSWFFRDVFFYTDKDETLLSYYENKGLYKPHRDVAEFTFIAWFFREPRRFEGGDFLLSDYKYRVPLENNKAIIFPSKCSHEVEPVSMDLTYTGQGFGRYAISIFIKLSADIGS